MSTPVIAARVGRSYTRARRHPWVLGKVGDWTLPLGPYTPAQLVIAAGGIYVLIKTFAWWSFMGPVPVIALGVAVWAVRASRIGGRSPLWIAYGWALYALQPSAGRISGRSVRERRPRVLTGSILIEETTAPDAQGDGLPTGRRTATAVRRPRRAPAAPTVRKTTACRRGRRRPTTGRPVPAARPVPTPVQQLLRRQQGVGR
ncbi:hypothetical protein PBV52_50960 (plasmid) [Streptomyces sp. T12]|uniref:hypothetical protein n=2 Tax=unclassified Streptomyces TaxID=2593676 RepID=UPI002364FED3|nr:hypothetical protein [Streptomyces sp. T12]WDF45036.1 hypothetical protein PBV52_50960 [Streptomyces sp. T12]